MPMISTDDQVNQNVPLCRIKFYIDIYCKCDYVNMILECFTDSDCTGRADTCVMGKCKCGEHEECSVTETCSAGECQSM